MMAKKYRIFFEILGFFLLLFPQFGSSAKAQKREKPNFLIILTDEQEYNDVSYYGSKEIKTHKYYLTKIGKGTIIMAQKIKELVLVPAYCY